MWVYVSAVCDPESLSAANCGRFLIGLCLAVVWPLYGPCSVQPNAATLATVRRQRVGLGGHLTTHHSSRGLCVYIDIGSDIPRFIISGCLLLLFRLKFPPWCCDHLLDIFCWNLLLLKSEWLIIGSKRYSDSRIRADICFLWMSFNVGLGILPILRFLRTLHFNWDMYLYYNNLVG